MHSARSGPSVCTPPAREQQPQALTLARRPIPPNIAPFARSAFPPCPPLPTACLKEAESRENTNKQMATLAAPRAHHHHHPITGHSPPLLRIQFTLINHPSGRDNDNIRNQSRNQKNPHSKPSSDASIPFLYPFPSHAGVQLILGFIYLGGVPPPFLPMPFVATSGSLSPFPIPPDVPTFCICLG